ncbi:MAG TPA: hypothetical protein VGF45_17365 [Polyangia bacterium]
MKSGTWLKLAMVPALAGGMLLACGDSDDPPTTPTGTGGTMAPAGTGGTTGGGTPDGGAPETPPAATVVEVNADITADTTWNGGTYLLKQKIYVVNNAKLTIAAGTKILGDATATEKAALIVTRGAQLIANGTKAAPVVFTSSAAEGAKKGGDWAGVALLGSAKINTGAPCPTGEAGCLEAGIEGIAASEVRAKFGGTVDTSSCGTLNYVRIEFAGAELEPMKELNGLTFGGCGSGTKASYIQVHRGTDDGIELFGGTVGLDHVLLTGNEDDSLDWDYGWSGKVQFLAIHQRAGIGDNGIEAAGSPTNETALPRAAPLLYNVTMLGRAGGGRAITFKEGTHGKLHNAIIQGFKGDVVDFQAKVVDLNMEWPTSLAIENSLFWDNGNYTDESMPNAMGASQDDDKMFNDKAAVEAAERSNKIDVNPGLTAGDLSTAAVPNYVPSNAAIAGQPAPVGVADVTASYAGAFAPGAPAWTEGWTAYPAN